MKKNITFVKQSSKDALKPENIYERITLPKMARGKKLVSLNTQKVEALFRQNENQYIPQQQIQQNKILQQKLQQQQIQQRIQQQKIQEQIQQQRIQEQIEQQKIQEQMQQQKIKK